MNRGNYVPLRFNPGRSPRSKYIVQPVASPQKVVRGFGQSPRVSEKCCVHLVPKTELYKAR